MLAVPKRSTKPSLPFERRRHLAWPCEAYDAFVLSCSLHREQRQVIFGLCKLLRSLDLTANLTVRTVSLYDLAAGHRGTEKVDLSYEKMSTFEEIKRRLIAKPQLAHPDLLKHLIVQTDASLIAIGAVLLQCNEAGVERQVSIYSKKLWAPLAELLHVRARMPRRCVGGRTLSRLPLRTSGLATHRPQGA